MQMINQQIIGRFNETKNITRDACFTEHRY